VLYQLALCRSARKSVSRLNTVNRGVLQCCLGLAVLLGLASAVQAQTFEGGAALRGQALYDSRCFGCHSEDANRVGPMHRGVLGRKAGGVADFMYSKALEKSTLVWTASTLDAWLKNPQALIPGQTMNVTVPNPQDRADIVAYLMGLK
jgi:cytochrome c